MAEADVNDDLTAAFHAYKQAFSAWRIACTSGQSYEHLEASAERLVQRRVRLYELLTCGGWGPPAPVGHPA
jgi:acyl-CoA reductase-like NAD-dependent aldehyde dehydrogenase